VSTCWQLECPNTSTSIMRPCCLLCARRLAWEGVTLAQQEWRAPVNLSGEATPDGVGQLPGVAGIAHAGNAGAQRPPQPEGRCPGRRGAAAAVTVRPPAWHGPAQDRSPAQPAPAHRGTPPRIITSFKKHHFILGAAGLFLSLTLYLNSLSGVTLLKLTGSLHCSGEGAGDAGGGHAAAQQNVGHHVQIGA
jgi:hypothetical protein